MKSSTMGNNSQRVGAIRGTDAGEAECRLERWVALFRESTHVPTVRVAALHGVIQEYQAASRAVAASYPASKRRAMTREYLARLHELRLQSLGKRAWQPAVLDWLRNQEQFIDEAVSLA